MITKCEKNPCVCCEVRLDQCNHFNNIVSVSVVQLENLDFGFSFIYGKKAAEKYS